MSNGKKDLKFQWPLHPKDPTTLAEVLHNIQSPYEAEKPPFCYPGTHLRKTILGRAKQLLAKQINAIGSHTHIETDDDGNMRFRTGEGGFDVIQRLEAEAIWMLASVLGGNHETIDGYFCGGGSEANLQGIWMGREWLRLCPDPAERGICVLTTPLVHYSITKASEILDLGHPQMVRCTICKGDHVFMPDPRARGVTYVGMDDQGQMSVDSLEEMFRRRYEEGFRRFLITPTIGTCLLGSIDPIDKIGAKIEELKRKYDAFFYMHVDASFAGFTVPFVNPDLKVFFQVPQVRSITVDGDKMGQLPYPAGVFLCRKDLMRLVARRVNYVRGNEDDTVSGSRSCIAPVIAWYLFQEEGFEGQREYVQNCLAHRDYFVAQVKKRLPWIRFKAISPWVNFAPMVIDFENGFIPDILAEMPKRNYKNEIIIPERFKDFPRFNEMVALLAPYHLRRDFFPSNPGDIYSCGEQVYKICIMPHHTEDNINRFISDLELADELWKSAKT